MNETVVKIPGNPIKIRVQKPHKPTDIKAVLKLIKQAS